MVGIIGILAAIAVPNFLEAQVRSKIAKTVQSQQFIALGLESYLNDYGHYPYAPRLIKHKQAPVTEELIIPEGRRGTRGQPFMGPGMMPGGGMNPFVPMGARSATPVAQPTPTPATDPPEYKEEQLQQIARIQERFKNRQQQVVRGFSRYTFYPFSIVTPETLIKELGGDEFITTRDPAEMYRYGFFNPDPGIFRDMSVSGNIIEANVINQNIYSTALYALTTPITYVAEEYLEDSFSDAGNYPFNYLNYSPMDPGGIRVSSKEENVHYAIISWGPNTELDYIPTVGSPVVVYDATNGTVSPGDVIRWSTRQAQ